MDEEDVLLNESTAGQHEANENFDEDALLGEPEKPGVSANFEATDDGDRASSVLKMESIDHEELDYEEDDEKEERESKFTSERAKKSPIRPPEGEEKTKKIGQNGSGRGSYNNNRGNRGRGGFRGGGGRFAGGAGASFMSGGMGGPMGMVPGGVRFMGHGPISLLTANIPPLGINPQMVGPGNKILFNPNFPPGAMIPQMQGGFPPHLAPPMAGAPLGGPLGGPPKVTLSIDGAPPLAVQPRTAPVLPHIPMGIGMGRGLPPMNEPPPNTVNLARNMMGGMPGVPPSAMRFPPGMGPPMPLPPHAMGPGMSAAPPGQTNGQGNWNLMVEAFLGDKKDSEGRSRKKRRKRSRSSSYSSGSSSYSSSSRSRSRSPRRSRKRDSKRHRKTRERHDRHDRRVYRGSGGGAGQMVDANGIPSLLSLKTSRRTVEKERQREDDSRESAKALGLDEDYLKKVEEQQRMREEYRRRRNLRDSPSKSRGRDESRASKETEESKKKAYLAVHVRNVKKLGDEGVGRVKVLANEVGETKKVWKSASDIVTIIFVELQKAKEFMLKYNGKVLSGVRVSVALEKMYLNLSQIPSAHS